MIYGEMFGAFAVQLWGLFFATIVAQILIAAHKVMVEPAVLCVGTLWEVPTRPE